MPNTLNNLIHIAKIYGKGGGWRHLYLRKTEAGRLHWYELHGDGQETESPVNADSTEEAIRLARRHWKDDNFACLGCGLRFTLPERDEIGSSALFHQMVASYGSMNGIYLDEELGHQCIIHDASQEALAVWHKLR